MEDRKEYSIIGKVEIGTDEYRDLIESAVNQEKRADEYRTKYWNEESERKKRDAKIVELKAEIKKLKELLATTTAGFQDDAVSMLMKILGEE